MLGIRADLEKCIELDHHWVEFDDVRYHVQVSMKNPHILLLSLSLPTPPLETVFVGGLPFGAIEAIKAAYGVIVQILDPPRDGFNLTLKLNLFKLPQDEDQRHTLLVKIASVREVVLGAPLRVILKHLASRTVAPDIDQFVALVHRPNESFFLVPQAEKVTVVFPMRFKDSIDTVLATSFLQEFMESRRTAGLSNAPPCLWSQTPPLELKGVTDDALSANAGFVTFGSELCQTRSGEDQENTTNKIFQTSESQGQSNQFKFINVLAVDMPLSFVPRIEVGGLPS
ncbi:hypothetical protein GOBAR_DD10456 [Gossypium barbadense]|nr:hypothetical protein GOBAR_DD10456 [Gossypium barbadense]